MPVDLARTALHARPRYDAVREMRAFRAWAASLPFPDGPWPDRGYADAKIALPQALLTRPAIANRAAQVLIDTAARLAREKPARHRNVRVMAILTYPDLFGSELCFFFDEDDFEAFTRRDSAWRRWTPMEGESLVQRDGLTLPPGFSEAGYRTMDLDDDGTTEHFGEVWLVGEIGRRDAR